MHNLQTMLVTAALVALVVGCGTTRTQQVMFKATESLGTTVEKAKTAFNTYMALKATDAVGPDNTLRKQWIMAQPEWQELNQLNETYSAAYRAWVNSNAVASEGLELPLLMAAASDVFNFVARFVPSFSQVGADALNNVQENVQ